MSGDHDDYTVCTTCGGYYRIRGAHICGPSKIGTRLGGPDDDHYAILTIQPRDAVRAWGLFWPKQVIHQLGEAVYSIARCGTKDQLLRDLKKAKWCLEDAIRWLEDNPSSR